MAWPRAGAPSSISSGLSPSNERNHGRRPAAASGVIEISEPSSSLDIEGFPRQARVAFMDVARWRAGVSYNREIYR